MTGRGLAVSAAVFLILELDGTRWRPRAPRSSSFGAITSAVLRFRFLRRPCPRAALMLLDRRESDIDNPAIRFHADEQGRAQSLRTGPGEYAAEGRFELYKASAEHEGAVGRRQHGFPSQDEVPL